MFDINISSNTTINPVARDRFYSGSDRVGILILHGFTGFTGEMVYLGKQINQETNYTVYIPRLPGHGTTSEDFRQSCAHDWLRKAYDSYLKLKLECKKVYLIGLSMGGLLGIITAARFKVDKLVLIAPALYTHSHLLPFTHILKFIIPEIKKPKNLIPDETQFESEYEKSLFKHYWNVYYTAQVAELHKLMILARKRLPDVISDTLILASKKDKQVPMKAAYKIRDNINSPWKKIEIFNNSPHVINNGPEKGRAAKKIIKFLKE